MLRSSLSRVDSTRCLSKKFMSTFAPVSRSLQHGLSTSNLKSISTLSSPALNRIANAPMYLTHHSKYLFSDQTKDEVEAEIVDSTENNTTNQEETSSSTSNTTESIDPSAKPTFDEHIDSNIEQHSFQTETKQLLDIVAHSLYTDKEVFLRELLSNSSDALEKTRYYLNTQSENIIDPERALEINVFTDKENSRLIIQDTGIGMSDQDLISNLGTIARSGSKAFVEAMKEGQAKSDTIIGQFGVGFYSIFMVCDKVEVYSRPATSPSDSTKGFYWTSDGSGSYSLAEASNVDRGTKIILHLKPECNEFCDDIRVENIIKKYSSFLEFSIKLNGKLMSSTGAIWSKQPKSGVDEEQYRDFYQMISDRSDDPYYTYHTHFDTSQFSAQCLLYVPEFSGERFGGRQPSGVSLYCRKVLVSKNCQEIVPEWLRFLKGVIDCENIPIHISRENMQDSQLMEQLRESVMTKIIDYLNKQGKKDRSKYNKWFKEFDGFVKEGVVSFPDMKTKEKICKLLRFQVTPGTKVTDNIENNDEGELTLVSFDEYIAGLSEDQQSKKEIYYLQASNRDSALRSPYIEAFVDEKIPVLLCYQSIDEWVMKNLEKYKDYKLIGVEQATTGKDDNNNNTDSSNNDLTEDNINKLGEWMKEEFNGKIEKCEITNRLKSHPCVLVDHTPQAIRQLYRSMGANADLPIPPQTMQINPKHPIIKELFSLIDNKDGDGNDKIKAKIVGQQLVNNSFIAAGLIEDAKEILGDVNQLIELALGVNKNEQLNNDNMTGDNNQSVNEQLNNDDSNNINDNEFGDVEAAVVNEREMGDVVDAEVSEPKTQ